MRKFFTAAARALAFCAPDASAANFQTSNVRVGPADARRDAARTSVLPHLHRRCIILCGKFDRTPAGALSRQPVIDKHHHSHPPVGGNGLDHT